MQIPVNQFETYADGLDHAEDIAFDNEGILWAGGEIGQVYRIPEKGRIEEVTNRRLRPGAHLLGSRRTLHLQCQAGEA